MNIFKTIILSLTIILTSLNANTENFYDEVFIADDAVIQGGSCSFQCRKVAEGYGTQITSIDIVNGRTKCKVFPINDYNKELSFDAGTKNISCLSELKNVLSGITSDNSNNSATQVSSNITYVEDDSQITLSRFLSGMVTLDPSVIDRKATKTAGSVIMPNGVTTRGQISGLFEDKNSSTDSFLSDLDSAIKFGAGYSIAQWYKDRASKSPTAVPQESVKLSDSMTKVNFVYFSNLFEAFNDIYSHLQNLLFVVVGMFFLGTIGSKKIQDYLENRGTSGNKEPFLHKFFIPLLVFGTFFMPIPEGDDDFKAQATIVQHTIRYFTASATKIADIASAKGAKVYMDKVFNAVGGIGDNAEVFWEKEKARNNFILEQGTILYQKACVMRYPNLKTEGIPFVSLTKQEIEVFQRQDLNNLNGKDGDISIPACIQLEKDIAEARYKFNSAEKALSAMNNYKKSDFISEFLGKVDNFAQQREYELGWLNTAVLPTTALITEMSSTFLGNNYQDFLIQNDDEREKNTAKSIQAQKEMQEKGMIDNKDSGITDFLKSIAGWAMGNLSYAILPGFGTIKEVFGQIYDSAKWILMVIAGASMFLNPIIGGSGLLLLTVGGGIAKPFVTLIATAWAMERVLESLPIIIAGVATAIAIVSYLVSLTKYYFISPFVVAYALTTKRLDKITEFLISGISLFFKPVLIVIFVYLSLFIYVYVKDIFLMLSQLQYQIVETNGIGILQSFFLYFLQNLTKIFAYLASSYIMWRMIVGGAEWTMKYIGIDKDNDSNIAQSMSQRLEQKAFMGG